MALMKRKRIGVNDAMSVVTRFVNACNRHDADGVAACLHPDFDSIQPMYPTRNFRGADQVRRNWQAIFDAEPGFRLTVLRSAAIYDTVWLELHGAGRDAEVAGVFIMGVVGDRIRWARIYSALVEPVAPGVGDATDPAASLQEVPQPDGSPASGSSEVVDEDLIAPVVDIERSGRRRRRRRGSDGDEGVEAQPVADEAPVEPEPAVEAPVEAEPAVQADGEPEVAVVVVTEEADSPVAEPDAVAVVIEDSGPPTEAVEMVTLTEPDPEPDAEPEVDPDPEPAAEVLVDAAPPAAAGEPVVVAEPAPESPKRRFGKRGRT